MNGPGAPAPTSPARRRGLAEQFRQVRARTEALAAPLTPEDQTIQSMPDASPTKWHRAHTTWFFETFVLQPHAPDYRVFDPAFGYVFNSYYEAAGPRHPRPSRGVLSRPGVAEVAAYRAHVDAAMERLIPDCDPAVLEVIVLGLNHEQQHQELLLTDIKHAFSVSPLLPAYGRSAEDTAPTDLPPVTWQALPGGLYDAGFDLKAKAGGFCFDNETPRHQALLQHGLIADRPVSNGEFLDFIADGGYRRPEFWLSEGWAIAQAEDWQAPGYWRRCDGDWRVHTLLGERAVRHDEPVCHVSHYEAAAFAEWSGNRLPTEFEWEVAAALYGQGAAAPYEERLHPGPLKPGVWQDVWEWTASPYTAYPGFRAPAGALGEYNGKFMINQMVLRGRSVATAPGHERISYRNFFPAHARWQFTGFRLARNA